MNRRNILSCAIAGIFGLFCSKTVLSDDVFLLPCVNRYKDGFFGFDYKIKEAEKSSFLELTKFIGDLQQKVISKKISSYCISFNDGKIMIRWK